MISENQISISCFKVTIWPKQETAEDSKAGLQSKVQNLNAKVNHNVYVRKTDGQTDNINP